MDLNRRPTECEREAQTRRQIVRGTWLATIGFVIVFFSGSVPPFLAYLAIVSGSVLIGHGGNTVIRPLMAEGLRLRRQ